MNKFLTLIENEFKKQYKKISIVILLVLTLLFSIFMPVLLNYLNSNDTPSWYIENLNHEKESLNNSITYLRERDDKASKLDAKFTEARLDHINFLIENNISSFDDWRRNNSETAFQKYCEILMVDAVLDGYTKRDLSSVNMYMKADDELEFLFSKSKDELTAEKEKLKKEYSNLLEVSKGNDFKSYNKANLENAKASVKLFKDDLKLAEEELKADSTNKILITKIDTIKTQLLIAEDNLKVNEYRYENNISYNTKDWKHNTLRYIENNLSTKYDKPLDENQFKEQYSYQLSQGMTYDKYLESFKKNLETTIEQLEINWYSLEHNLPQIRFVNDARSTIDSLYLVYLAVVSFICVVIAGNIVSSEFSKGTIRLLILRPVSRWKLLLSKLLTVFILGYALLLICILLTTISSGIIYGFNTLSIPVLSCTNNTIVSQSFFSYLAPKLLFASISLIFLISLSFFISTVIKNTALAVGLTMFLYLAGSTIVQFMCRFKMLWSAYTILPYVNLSTFIGNSYMVQSFYENFGINLSPTFGAIQLIIVSLILLIISFIVFIREDIKN